ncbi:MAG: 1-acyl-sn-glycerol-3-phosphate acyltransferase, partial [Clostridia bacterium]|nr:1-acyl-sn-glycerol-3-phosphate acyltransferase [Clostridia bacterium]
MKIKVKKLPYEKVKALPAPARVDPKRPARFFRFLMKTLGAADLKDTSFENRFTGGLSGLPDEPCLILMNHSSFIDLEIAASIIYPEPFAIVCTSDGFVGKEGLMRNLGCIPTNKFVTDVRIITDMKFALEKNRTHVLLYPEASYSFDGRATPLPRRMGVVLKKLGVPVVMIRTYGAFTRDPLYNMLQKRKVKVSSETSLLFSREDLKAKTVDEIDLILDEKFSFDNFEWQRENHIRVDEPFRADGLERILFRCPCCGKEGFMQGKGTRISCDSCGASAELDEYGSLAGNFGFGSVPEWYAWERSEIAKEVENGSFMIDCDVNILVLRDFKAVYDIGKGHLTQDAQGIRVTGANGELDFTHPASASYSLYADYFWYELG